MRLSVALAAATILSTAAAPVLAQTQQPPAAAQLRPAASVAQIVRGVDVPYSQFTLPNGLRVIVHTDRAVPVVSVALWFNVGSKDEPQGQTGFAHLFEHLLFAGTQNVANPTEVLRDLGATDRNGSTWFDRTNYYQTVPTAALERTLFLERERMTGVLPVLTQERLDNQRGVVQNEKRQGDNQPFGLVEYATLEGLFPEGHPYRHDTIGSMADLDAASLETVQTWFRNSYGPNNAVLVLAGDVDLATARRLVTQYFGDIPRGRQNVPAAADVPTLAAPVNQVMQDRVANTRLYRTWTVPGRADATSIPLDLAADILGGLASSRLDNALVRGDQSAVSVSANLQRHQRVGMFGVTVDVKPGQDADAVARRLDAEIARFITEGPTADEVQRAAMRSVTQNVARLDQTIGVQGVLAEGALYHDDPAYLERELQAYASATPAQVRTAMQRWLTRPSFNLRVNPGPRPAYEEAQRPARMGGTAPPAAIEVGEVRPTSSHPGSRGVVRLPSADAVRVTRPLPALQQVRPLDFPAVQRARLSNGVEIVYARNDDIPFTQMAVEFDAGVAADPAQRQGTQRLMLDLLTEGTTTLNSVQLAEAQERLGATLNANASLDRTAVTLTAPSANLAPSLTLLGDVIQNPAFTPAEVERLRQRQLAGLAVERTQPAAVAGRAMAEILYGASHPYGRPQTGLGSVESVRAITREDLTRFHESWIRPDNARIFIVSDQPLSRIQPLLEQRLGAWRAPGVPRGTKPAADTIPAPTPRIVLIDRPQSPQSLIVGGQVLPISGAADDVLVLNAANEVLANNFLSRINTDLRETRGWSYGVRGAPNLVAGRVPYLINAPVQADRTGDSIAALLDNYRAFNRDRGVTVAERERTVNGSARQLAGQFQTGAAVLNALRTNALYGRPDDYYERAAVRYPALTTAELDAAVRQTVNPDQFVWVVVGDAATVRPQLERLGLPVEVRPAG